MEHEPRLTEPLQASHVIREGQPVKLSCRFEAHPKGDVQWLKDGVPIDFEALGISRDFKVIKEVDYTALLIKEGFPEDTGSYAVVIRNTLGEARSFTQLIVEEFFCRTPESEMAETHCKPVFVQSLMDTTVNEGQKLKLHAAINAQPEPEIIWYRNDIPLKNSRDLFLTFDGQLCTLIKDRCEKENDTGMYRLTAVNSMGQAESICQVIVQSNDTQLLRERLQTVRSAPVFTQALQETSVHDGERLLLQVRILGQPKPQVTWYKDNQPLRSTSDCLVRNDNDVYLLDIGRVSIRDSGLYQVRAVTRDGEAQCSAVVNISPTRTIPAPIHPPSNGSPPKFVQLFIDQKSSIGSTVRFEARVTGTQPLNVYWLFNTMPLARLGHNPRYQQTIINDTCTLIIHQIRFDDVGRYTLNVDNPWGKATCSAELLIPPQTTLPGKRGSRRPP